MLRDSKNKHDRSIYPEAASIVKKPPLDIDYLHGLNLILNEWESNEDEQAYKNL